MNIRTEYLPAGTALTAQVLKRSGGVDAEIIGVAAGIITDVRKRGDAALYGYAERFDGVDRATLGALRVSAAEIEAAYAAVDDELVAALRHAAVKIEDFHRRQVRQSWFTTDENGVLLGSKVTPLRRVGIYVPGGRAIYPSSVLMNALPARCAGVGEIALCAPPTADGGLPPVTIVAAHLAGITEMYKVGGAQAIAALAYGTESIPAVDKITGPGNAFVAAAKKLVNGDVGIDMIAGPSEVLVIADATADAHLVALDLMAQAEHDPRAAVYLLTTEEPFVAAVEGELDGLLAETPRREITEASLCDNGVALVCGDLPTALAAADFIAPEHLELQVAEPLAALGAVHNAGAVFLGRYTPEAVGDYVAGPNHVLPTGGTARFSSPLSVDDFITKSSVLCYTPAALAAEAPFVAALATCEGLWSHGQSVVQRTQRS